MLKHIILWKIKDDYDDEKKATVRREAKVALETLVGKIDGLVSLSVEISPLPSSNADMMLDSTFVDEAALSAYQKHPLHQSAANGFVRPHMCQRLCLDFNIND